MLKALANAVMARKEELYELSYDTGATRADSWIDIEGGAGTLFSFSSKGRRELPNGQVLIDGAMEPLSRGGSFVGQHVFTPLQGVAVHINAFNFPVWGMLEKLGADPARRRAGDREAGAARPAISTEAAFRIMIEADVLPHGALQLIMGATGDLLDHLTCQDVVSFTGSAATAMKLQSHPVIAREVGPLRRRARQPQRLDPRPRRGARHAGVRPVRQGGRARDDRQGGAEMHRHPPRHGARRAISTRCRRRCPSGSPRSRIGDPRDEATQMGALASQAQLRVGPRGGGRARANRRGSSPAIPTPRRSPATAPSSRPILLRSDDPWGIATRCTTSRRSARSRRSCPIATSTTRSRSPIAAWAASRSRSSPIDTRRSRASSCSAPAPITAAW